MGGLGIGNLLGKLANLFGVVPFVGSDNSGLVLRHKKTLPGEKECQFYHDGTDTVMKVLGNSTTVSNLKIYNDSGYYLTIGRYPGVANMHTILGSGNQLILPLEIFVGGWGTSAFDAGNSGICTRSNLAICWSNSTSDASIAYSGTDTGLKRIVAGVIGTTAGTSGSGWIQNTSGSSRVTTSNVTNATATMANITGLTATLIAGRKYSFKMILFVDDSVAAEGLNIDFDGGTATMTSFRAHGTIFDTALVLSQQTTAIATDFAAATVTGSAIAEIHGGFVCNGAGTFIPRFSQNTHVTGTATVYVDSHLLIEDMP